MRRLTIVVWLCALFVTASCIGQTRKQAAKKPTVSGVTSAPSLAAKLQGLDDLAAQAMTQWKVPGVALAVVRDGKVIYAKGYGYRDLENKLPVTTATLFPIGSITKSFTALTFAILKNEGKVEWDKPVRSYLPEFQMYDPVASEQATPRDLSRIAQACHATTSSGIPRTSPAKIWSAACAISSPTRDFAVLISTTTSLS